MKKGASPTNVGQRLFYLARKPETHQLAFLAPFFLINIERGSQINSGKSADENLPARLFHVAERSGFIKNKSKMMKVLGGSSHRIRV